MEGEVSRTDRGQETLVGLLITLFLAIMLMGAMLYFGWNTFVAAVLPVHKCSYYQACFGALFIWVLRGQSITRNIHA